MVILSILVFVLVFSSLVLVHEWGHFRAALWAKVRAEEFAIGFGKTLVSWRRGETLFRINLFPLGGFVKMTGEESQNDAENTDPRSFGAAKVHKRIVIALAGVIMNIIFAILLLTVLYTKGTTPFLVTKADVLRAEAAGVITLSAPDENGGRYITEMNEIQYHFPKSFIEATKTTAYLSKSVVVKVAEIPKSLIERGKLPEGMSGPLGIAEITHKVTPEGLWAILRLTAVLSISLAVMNLLPIPGLDGGMMVFLLYEVVTRRKPNEKVQIWLTMAGFGLLFLFFIAVTWADIARIFLGA